METRNTRLSVSDAGPSLWHRFGNKASHQPCWADKARALLLRDKPFGAEEALDSGFLTEICEREVWDLRFDKIKHDGLALSAEAFEALSDRTVIDTRDADLVALIKSVCQGSIKDRITAYLETVKAKPKENRSR